jgi:hypothetical protein
MQLYKSYVANSKTYAYMGFRLRQRKDHRHRGDHHHNLRQDIGTVRIRIGNDATFLTNEYDSGTLDAWPTVEEFGYLAWGGNFTGAVF